MYVLWSKTGVPKQVPGAKKVPAKKFYSALGTLKKITFVKSIENSATLDSKFYKLELQFDMV